MDDPLEHTALQPELPQSGGGWPVDHAAICDACEFPIVAVRLKCLNCADFDLCESCEAAGRHGHPPGHVYLKLRWALPPPAARPALLLPPLCPPPPAAAPEVLLHEGVVCDGCEGPLLGPRFLCAHCPELDLCERCEAAGHPHTRLHPFIVARQPLPRRHLRPSCLLPPLGAPPAARRPRVIPQDQNQALAKAPSPLAHVEVRTMQAADVAAVLMVEAQSFDQPYPREYFERALRGGQVRVVVAGDPAAAYCAFSLQRIDAGAMELRVASLAVSPAWRRAGLAAALLRHVLACGRGARAQLASLHVALFNAPAVRLYRANGFHAVRWLRAYYGPNEDALLMHAPLQS